MSKPSAIIVKKIEELKKDIKKLDYPQYAITIQDAIDHLTLAADAVELLK